MTLRDSMRMLLLPILMAYLRLICSFSIDSKDCGSTKSCLIKPVGCKPEKDCTLFVKFNAEGNNLLHIQMTALTIIPLVPLQYIAVGFSDDKLMGDDMVIECVVSTDNGYGYFEPEVYVSYNHKAANDRTYLSEADRQIYFRNISGGIEDESIYCEFWVQIIPQIAHRCNRTWNLDKNYYILAATGTAQPDELNAHDTSLDSYFYPVVSDEKINPAETGITLHDFSNVPGKPINSTVERPSKTLRIGSKESTAQTTATSSATFIKHIRKPDMHLLFSSILLILLTNVTPF